MDKGGDRETPQENPLLGRAGDSGRRKIGAEGLPCPKNRMYGSIAGRYIAGGDLAELRTNDDLETDILPCRVKAGPSQHRRSAAQYAGATTIALSDV